MKTVKTIVLPNKIKLCIDESGLLTCIDTDGTHIALTAGQEKLLKKLAEAPGRTFSCGVLHAAYATETGQLTYTGTLNSSVAKMKNTFPKCIRIYMKNRKNLGYYLEHDPAATVVPVLPTEDSSPITQLCGEYYCFYLNPLGNDTLLNAYLRIQNEGTETAPQMTAHIVADIRNHGMLMDEKLSALFSSASDNYKEDFRVYKEPFSENDKRSTYGKGNVSYEEPFANLEFKMNHGKWKIDTTLKNYLTGNREKDSEKNYYRGGIGLLTILNKSSEIYCLKIGLIKKSFFNASFFNEHDKIVEILKIDISSMNSGLSLLKLDPNLDKNWYDLFMRNSPQ